MKKLLQHTMSAHGMFVIIALVFGLALMIITPPLWGADEGAHFIRAYQISRGEFSQKPITLNGQHSNAGLIPSSFARLNDLRAADISDAVPGEKHQVDDISAYNRAANVPISKDKLVVNPYGKIIYSPIVYIAPAAGIFVSHFFNPAAITLLYMARLATLIFFISLVAIATYILRKTAVKWLVFVIALLPMSLYQASVVSPDSLLLGLSLIFFAILYVTLYANHRLGRKEIALITLTACALTLVKMPYVFLTLSLVLLPLPKSISPRKKLFIKFGIPLLSIMVALFSLISVRGGAAAINSSGIDLVGQLHAIVFHPAHYLYMLANSITVLDWVPQIIGLFGSSFIFIPGIMIQVLLVSLALTTFLETKKTDYDTDKADKLSAITNISASLLVALAIITTLYLAWTPVGANLVQGIQGRYFLPIVAFFLLGLRQFTRARLLISEKSAIIGYPLLAIVTLFISLAWYYRILY